MTTSGKRWFLIIDAAVLIAAAIVGVYQLGVTSGVMILTILATGVIGFLVVKVWADGKTRVIFRFYVAANEILVGGDKSRYHFEIAEVINTGEKIVKWMPDAPPLTRFALGALYHSIGDYSAAAGHLSLAAEEEVLKESPHMSPSRQLRRYVRRLRVIQRRPRRAAKILAAIASLELMHKERAARLLAESQQQLRRLVEIHDGELSEQMRGDSSDLPKWTRSSLKSMPAPPPISDVLNDVYPEDIKPS